MHLQVAIACEDGTVLYSSVRGGPVTIIDPDGLVREADNGFRLMISLEGAGYADWVPVPDKYSRPRTPQTMSWSSEIRSQRSEA